MDKDLKFYLVLNGESVEVNPFYKDFKAEDSPEKDSVVLRRKFNGNLTFYGPDFNLLMPIEKSVNRCAPIPIVVDRRCGNGYVNYDSGALILSNAKFDLNKCTIQAKITKDDEYFDIEQNKDKEFNLLEVIPTRKTLKFTDSPYVFEPCSRPEINLSGNYIVKCANVMGPEWSLDTIEITGVRTNYTINTKWIKPIGGGKIFTFLVPDRSSSETLPTTGDFDVPQTYSFKYLGTDPFVEFDSCIRFDEAIIYIASQFGLTVRSDFFQINPLLPSATNYVTGVESLVRDLLLIQVTDAQRPTSTGTATKAIVTWDKLIKDLKTIFQIDYIVKNGVLIIEHVSWFKGEEVLDLTTEAKYIKWIEGKQQYSYDNDKQPASEKWELKNGGILPDAQGVAITYNNGCTLADRATNTKEFKTEILTTDLYAVLAGNTKVNSDGQITATSDISTDGLVLIAAKKNPDGITYSMLSEPGILTPYVEPNNTLGVAHIQDKYFRHNRSYRFGFLNNQLVTFLSSVKSKIGEVFKIPMCCSDEINLEAPIKTFLGTGEIQKSVFSLETGMVELTVGYASDEFDSEENQAPLANDDTAQTKEEKEVYIDVLANDANVNDAIIVITQQPAHGTASVVDNKIKYQPDIDFVGVDTIKYKLDKNGSISNEATVTVTVTYLPLPNLNRGQAEVNDDKYFTGVNTPLIVNAATGVLANDTFKDRRDVVQYNNQYVFEYDNVTAAGGTINMLPDGSFTYNAPAGYQGIDQFTYVTYFPGFDNNVFSLYKRAKVKIKVGEPITANYARIEIVNTRTGEVRGATYGDIVCSFYYDADMFFPKIVDDITVNYRITKKRNDGTEEPETGSVTAFNTNQVMIQAGRIISLRDTSGGSVSQGYTVVVETLIGSDYTPINP